RDSHIWGIRKGQSSRCAMAEPRSGRTTFMIMSWCSEGGPFPPFRFPPSHLPRPEQQGGDPCCSFHLPRPESQAGAALTFVCVAPGLLRPNGHRGDAFLGCVLGLPPAAVVDFLVAAGLSDHSHGGNAFFPLPYQQVSGGPYFWRLFGGKGEPHLGKILFFLCFPTGPPP
ncbi:hypothetical protein CRENBAI_011694, partial [Crenichthys baileyi]